MTQLWTHSQAGTIVPDSNDNNKREALRSAIWFNSVQETDFLKKGKREYFLFNITWSIPAKLNQCRMKSRELSDFATAGLWRGERTLQDSKLPTVGTSYRYWWKQCKCPIGMFERIFCFCLSFFFPFISSTFLFLLLKKEQQRLLCLCVVAWEGI